MGGNKHRFYCDKTLLSRNRRLILAIQTCVDVIQSDQIIIFKNEIPPQFPQRGNFAQSGGFPFFSLGRYPCPPSQGFYLKIGSFDTVIAYL
jgi:hypothetical protein